MDGQEETTDDDTGFLGGQQWDCDGCPPPFFDLPPPPRPPFMEDPDYCASTTATGGSPYDSCDNPLIVDSHGLSIQNDVLHVVLIVITSLVSVLLILIVAGIVWRFVVLLFVPDHFENDRPHCPPPPLPSDMTNKTIS